MSMLIKLDLEEFWMLMINLSLKNYFFLRFLFKCMASSRLSHVNFLVHGKGSQCSIMQKTFKNFFNCENIHMILKIRVRSIWDNIHILQKNRFSIKKWASKLCPHFPSTLSFFSLTWFKSGKSMASYIPKDPFSFSLLWWMQQ